MECITQEEPLLCTSHFPALKCLLSSDFNNFSLSICLGFISLEVNFSYIHPNVFHSKSQYDMQKDCLVCQTPCKSKTKCTFLWKWFMQSSYLIHNNSHMRKKQWRKRPENAWQEHKCNYNQLLFVRLRNTKCAFTKIILKQNVPGFHSILSHLFLRNT